MSGRHHRKGFKRNATVGRRGDITERALKEMPQSDVGATSQKGLYSQVNNAHNKYSIHDNKQVSPPTGITFNRT